MLISRGLRTALLFCAGVLLLTGCDPQAPAKPGPLPAITMTSGGGFQPSAQFWTIAPDGSWTWVQEDKSIRAGVVPSQKPARSGQLTAAQRDELALLANDPRLRAELRQRHGRCTISDGPEERLEVGSLRYLANWCHEKRPRIRDLRARIVALTTGS
jgi:hypothetical protein